MAAPLHYNYGGISNAAGQIRQGSAQLQTQHETIVSAMQKAAAIWGGTGSEQYKALQTKLNQTYTELIAANTDLANRLDQAGVSMQSTDTSVGAMFVGI